MRKTVRVIHNAPGKRGKQEYREFRSAEDALAYIGRNSSGRLGSPEQKEAWKKKS